MVGPTFAVNVAIAALGLGTGVLLARWLGPAGRGDAAAAIQWASVFVALGDFGIGFALAYFVAAEPRQRSELWALAISVAVVWGLLLAAGGSAVLPSHVQAGARRALVVAILAVPLGLLAGFQGYLLLGSNAVGHYNAARAGGAVTYFSILMAVLPRHPAAEIVGIAFVASQAVTAGLSGVFLARQGAPRWAMPRHLIRAVLSFGAKTQLASVAGHASLRLDQLLLSMLAASAKLGEYAVALAISGALAPLYSALAMVVIPSISRLAGGRQKAKEAFRFAGWALLGGIPVVGVGLAAMDVLVRLVFGNAFAGAVAPARILLVAGVFQGINAILGNALRTMGHSGAPAIAEGVGVVATVAGLAVMLRPYGIMGAAIASAIAYGVVTLLLVVLTVVRGRDVDANAIAAR